jgi:hypothetical protein
MALIATPGATNANSFVTLAEFNTYLSERLFSETASGASEPKKESALIMSTRLIGRWFIWNGAVWTQTQSLPFPRIGLVNANGQPIPEGVIPVELKEAVFELAIFFLNAGTTDPTQTGDTDNISKLKASSIEITFRDVQNTLAGKVMPETVSMLIPLSWYSAVITDDEEVYAEIDVL